jgi:hypothetical protein
MDLEAVAGGAPETIACPEPACPMPAEVVERFVLASTDGPVEHLKTWCLDGHGFTVPSELLVARPLARGRRTVGAGG